MLALRPLLGRGNSANSFVPWLERGTQSSGLANCRQGFEPPAGLAVGKDVPFPGDAETHEILDRKKAATDAGLFVLGSIPRGHAQA